jgi:glycosyltransferase involved in cell wall biosynthesis
MSMPTTASIIIATYNRSELLDECLRHLAKQTYASGDEVLIADNGSTDRTAAVVAAHARRFPAALTRIHVSTPGKSHAVAAALQVASGDIVAFTDDDVNVCEGWLARLKSGLSDPRVGLAGGPVEPRWEGPSPQWLQIARCRRLGAPLGLLDYGPAEMPLGARTLLGANMAVRRSVLQQVGGYATHLGKLRGTLLSGEDHELCQRIQAAGYAARYLPDARVTHWVPRDRMRLNYFFKWFYWSGITNAAIEGDTRPAHPMLGLPRHLLRQFAGGIVGGLGSALCGRLPVAVDRALDAAFAAGYAARRWGLVQPGPVARPLARSV